MSKFRMLTIAAAAVLCPLLAASGSAAGEAVRTAAVISAGNTLPADHADKAARTAEADGLRNISGSCGTSEPAAPQTDEPAPNVTAAATTSQTASPQEPAVEGQPCGTVISRSIVPFEDGLDLTAEGNHSGMIIREYYDKSLATDHITMQGGAQVRNCTDIDNEDLAACVEQLPSMRLSADCTEPQILIVHTHTTESYEPYSRSYYDADFPTRTRNSDRNITAVGEELAQTLAEHGYSVLHDGTIHDYPTYSGAYDRSEDTIRAALEEYPEIKVVIDLHRDAIENPNGCRIAPTAEINGQNAAQFMIIAGCDDGRFNMPEYMENLRLACLIQRSAEQLYPGLARPVLFDYRNYNQHITTGSLLIEVGSHANSFEEAMYTGRLLGESLAAALGEITE